MCSPLLTTTADAHVSQTAGADSFTLRVTAQFMVPPAGGEGALTVSLPELGLSDSQVVEFPAGRDNGADLFEASLELVVPRANVTLWWPAGGDYGTPKLYNVAVDFSPAGAACGAASTTPRGPASGLQIGTPGGADGVSVGIDFRDGFKLDVDVGDLFDFAINLGGLLTAPGDPNHPALPGNSPVAPGQAAAESMPGDVRVSASTCSSLHRRTGFRTVELITDPLPKAVSELFGSNPGFNLSLAKREIAGFLARDGQWALSEDGAWRHFPGVDPQVRVCVCVVFEGEGRGYGGPVA